MSSVFSRSSSGGVPATPQVSTQEPGKSEVRRHHGAEPGGHLPYVPSDYGYQWYDNHDGSYYAESRDNQVTLTLDFAVPGGQVAWSAEDDQGVIETGNFSGVANPSNRDGVFYRADRLLAEFDTTPNIPAKGFGYDPTYTEDFPSSYPAPDFRY